MSKHTKHTTGPWIASEFLCDSHKRLTIMEDKHYHVAKIIAQVYSDDSDDDVSPPIGLGEAEANARLMATAPELLAALKGLLPEGWGDDDTMDHIPGVKAARLAVAKAEGRAP